MSKQMSVNTISEQAQSYKQISLTLIIVAIIFAILTTVLWFVLNILHSLRVLIGFGVSKEVKRIKSDSSYGSKQQLSAGQHASITWNTSGLLKKTEVIDSNMETTVLEPETTVLDESIQGFVIEEDIRLTGTDQKI